MEFRHVYHPERLDPMLLPPGCVLELACAGKASTIPFQRHWRGAVKSLQLPWSSSWVSQWSLPLDDLLQQLMTHKTTCMNPEIMMPSSRSQISEIYIYIYVI